MQTCIVHLIRNSLDYAGWKDRKAVAVALRPIYAAASAQAAEQALLTFADGPWGIKYPTIVAAWQRAWEHVTPFFVFPGHQARDHDQRHRELEHAIAQDHQDARPLPNDEAAIKLLWLALRNVLAKSVRATFDWKAAMNQFAILFGERFTAARG